MNALAERTIDQLPLAPAASESAAILSVIERMALNPDIDPARIERFIDLKERMEAKVAKAAYNAAFVRMQPELPPIEKRGVGNNKKLYGLWEDIQEGVTPVLAKHGFGLSFELDQTAPNGDIVVTAVLMHEGGHDGKTPFVAKPDKSGNKNDIQSSGSTISYGKRYAACALLNIRVAGEDDDGKAAGIGSSISGDQLTKLRALADEVGGDVAKLCQHFGIEALPDLPAPKFDEAVKIIEAKRQRAGR